MTRTSKKWTHNLWKQPYEDLGYSGAGPRTLACIRFRSELHEVKASCNGDLRRNSRKRGPFFEEAASKGSHGGLKLSALWAVRGRSRSCLFHEPPWADQGRLDSVKITSEVDVDAAKSTWNTAILHSLADF